MEVHREFYGETGVAHAVAAPPPLNEQYRYLWPRDRGMVYHQRERMGSYLLSTRTATGGRICLQFDIATNVALGLSGLPGWWGGTDAGDHARAS